MRLRWHLFHCPACSLILAARVRHLAASEEGLRGASATSLQSTLLRYKTRQVSSTLAILWLATWRLLGYRFLINGSNTLTAYASTCGLDTRRQMRCCMIDVNTSCHASGTAYIRLARHTIFVQYFFSFVFLIILASVIDFGLHTLVWALAYLHALFLASWED